MCVRTHLSRFKIASHAEQHKHMCVYMYNICGQGSPTPRGHGPRLIFSAAVKDRQHLEARGLGGSTIAGGQVGEGVRAKVSELHRIIRLFGIRE